MAENPFRSQAARSESIWLYYNHHFSCHAEEESDEIPASTSEVSWSCQCRRGHSQFLGLAGRYIEHAVTRASRSGLAEERRFPKITVLGAHCGNPEFEWAAEIARWNSNVLFHLSESGLKKMHGWLAEFQKYCWWSSAEWHSVEWKVKKPNNDLSAFIKIGFRSLRRL